MPAWSSASSEEDDLYRVEQDQKVEEQRQILDVVEVVLQFFERIFDRSAVTVFDLGPAGDAGLHGQPFHVVRNLFLEGMDEFRTLGAGSDEAHVAQQDVEELRQLVEPCPSEQRPDPRHSRVTLLRPDRTGSLFRIPAHRAEFVENENAAVLAGAGLAIENGSPRL